jgi:outer membrane lipoprotein-sorting protein
LPKELDAPVNILRRLPLYRLLLLCAIVVAVGVSATALAFALDTGPTPPAKPLAQAIHDALGSAGRESIQGVSASVTWTDHLLEGASLASGNGNGNELTSSPLIAGASGRLWIAKDGHVRLELQSEKGDTQVLYDGHTLQVYDAATNTLYRYTPPAHERDASTSSGESEIDVALPDKSTHQHEIPSVAKIEEAISHAEKHANVSGATPTDVGGQPAYTVRVSPKESGSLLGGAELSFDADNGAPLRAAVYSSASSSPVMELAASEVSFGPVEESVFAFSPPPNAKIDEVSFSHDHHSNGSNSAGSGEGEKPKITTHGQGPSTIAVLEAKAKGGKEAGASLEGLPKVTINGASASELKTELGTLLTFERSGVRYVVAGSVSPAAVEEVAKGL